MSVQETLFNGDEAPKPAYLLTNRYNLLEFLAARIVGPRASMTKYYDDLLAIAPGRIPLISAPFPAPMVAVVTAEDPLTAFPVALEIDRTVLDGLGPPDGPSGTSMAPTGMFTLRSVRAIHFRNDLELQEHAAREYDNIRHPSDLYRSSPEMFAGSDDQTDLTWLRQLAAATDERAAIEHADRISGAASLMAALCPASEEAIETLRRILDEKRGRGSKSGGAWIVNSLAGGAKGKRTLDERLMSASLPIFLQSDVSQSWRPTEVLDSIWTNVGPSLDDSEREELERHFQRIREILRSERAFERLRLGGIPSEKALLLALMRPDPVRLAGLDAEEAGADWEVMLGAAALVGSLRGRRRMPIELRQQDLDDRLALAEVLAYNQTCHSPIKLPPLSSVLTTSRAVGGDRLVRLSSDGRMILERILPAEVRPPAISDADAADPEVRSALSTLCLEIGWFDCLVVDVVASTPPIELPPEGDASLATYRFSGDAEVRRDIDIERLLRRLGTDRSTESDRVRSHLASRQAGPSSHRYSN